LRERARDGKIGGGEDSDCENSGSSFLVAWAGVIVPGIRGDYFAAERGK